MFESNAVPRFETVFPNYLQRHVESGIHLDSNIIKLL